jgi:hypothetical protein
MRNIFILFIVGSLFSTLEAQPTDLIISEYVEGWSNNKALEIYNPTASAIDLSDYRIVRYSNGRDVPPADNQWAVGLPEKMLDPYRAYVVVLDKRDPEGTGQEAPVWTQLQERADTFACPVYDISKAMYFNGNDAVSLEKFIDNEWVFVDLFARYGAPAPAAANHPLWSRAIEAWTDTPPHFTGEGLGITADHTMVRKSEVINGVTVNPTVFNPLAEYDTLPANTFNHLGWHAFDGAPANETPVITNTKRTYAVSPSATNGTVITTIEATDAEQDELKFYIDYGNFIYIDNVRIEPFLLDKKTGVLSLVDQSGLAPEVLDTFNLAIMVTDGFSQLGPVYFKVIVTDDEVNVESYLKGSLKVYPNPVSGNQFQINSEKGIHEFTISNITGQLVDSKIYNVPVFEESFHFEKAQSGIYILGVKYIDGTKETKKLLLE